MTFDLERAKKAATVFEEWLFANPVDTIDISDVALSVWGYRAALGEIERLRSFRGRIARILGQSPSDCDDLLIVGLDSRIILAKRLTARIKELQDLIDKPPEEADWVADYHLLQSALDGPIIDAARKWHAAYRKAQNSNLMRAKEVERLRSVYLAYSRKHDENMLKVIARNKEQRARIKELEADRIAYRNLGSRIEDLETYIEQLEAAFLEAESGREYLDSVIDAFNIDEYRLKQSYREEQKAISESMAREALERIKER